MKNLLCLGMVFLMVGAAACSSDSSEKEPTIEVIAQNVRFTPDRIEVPAGQMVTLKLKNLDSTEHDLEVRGLTPSSISGGGHEGHGEPIRLTKTIAVHTDAKGSATVEFQADEKGTYEVVCTIPGHAEAGMVATLVVI
jgi:nitrite reductase (NO-forming)